jgi:nucleoside-diphosphate-sugar epimerase
MKVLITGNMGYVGPAVVKELRRSIPSATLIGCDPGWFASRVATEDRMPESLLKAQMFCDVRDLTISDLADIDCVVHLAAVSNDPMGQTYEKATDEINHVASVELGKLCKAAEVRHFIFASSASVYGVATDICNELSELNPQTAYAKSKVATERDLDSLASDDFMVTCLRFSTACGWSPRIRLDLVLNDFVAGALIDGEIRLISDGSPLRPLIATSDMARAITGAVLQAFSSDRSEFEAINIGSDNWNFTIGALAKRVGERMGNLTVVLGDKGGADTRSYALDFGKFRRLMPDWQPEATLELVIDDLAANLDGILNRSTEATRASFIRLKTLDYLRDVGSLNQNLRWT